MVWSDSRISALPLMMTTCCVSVEGTVSVVVVLVVSALALVIVVRLPGRRSLIQNSCHVGRLNFGGVFTRFAGVSFQESCVSTNKCANRHVRRIITRIGCLWPQPTSSSWERSARQSAATAEHSAICTQLNLARLPRAQIGRA